MVLGQKWPFFQLFVLGYLGQENVFCDIVERKTPFYAIKKKVQKTEKLAFLQRG